MKENFWKYKGYILHCAAVAIIFLTPSVQQALLAHPKTSAAGTVVWGFLLHWATGK